MKKDSQKFPKMVKLPFRSSMTTHEVAFITKQLSVVAFKENTSLLGLRRHLCHPPLYFHLWRAETKPEDNKQVLSHVL